MIQSINRSARGSCGGERKETMQGKRFSMLSALLTALITALSAASGVGLHIGAALCCAFLALMAGGILCFLRRYVTARFTCCCGQVC